MENAASSSDGLSFHGSAGPTIGIEVEMQIIDRETGGLGPGAIPLLAACERASVEGVSAEFMQSMIEIKTGICADATEAREQIFSVARKLRDLAATLGYDLALAGTHPFNRSSSNTVFPEVRFERIRDRMAWVASQDLIFGLHVHVGVPSGDMAIGLMNSLVQYLPHLLALSSNSPYWQSADTGLASFRAAFHGLFQNAGVPPYFKDWRDFKSYMHVMLASKAIESLKDVYWDIRPRPDFGTIEIRIFDVPSTLSGAVSLAALTRSLVIETQRRLEANPRLCRGDRRKQWITPANKWLATRYGLEGMNIRTPSGKRGSLGLDAAELIERLMPIARESGDDRFLEVFRPLSQFEGGADRQRRLYRESGSFRGIVDDQVRRLAADLAA